MGRISQVEKDFIIELHSEHHISISQLAKQSKRSEGVVRRILGLEEPVCKSEKAFIEIELPSTGEKFRLRIPASATEEDQELISQVITDYYNPDPQVLKRIKSVILGNKLKEIIEEECLDED